MQEGEAAKSMFFIIKGKVEIVSLDAEILINELYPGSFCKSFLLRDFC